MHERVRIVCPGCGGAKTRRAKLCKACRQRANTVGAEVWVQTHVPPAPANPRTPQQSRVYHAKCASIAALERAELRHVKAWALEVASRMFQRPFESSTQLTEIEMEVLLERLDVRLDELGYRTVDSAAEIDVRGDDAFGL